jgi:hypothetical protein
MRSRKESSSPHHDPVAVEVEDPEPVGLIGEGLNEVVAGGRGVEQLRPSASRGSVAASRTPHLEINASVAVDGHRPCIGHVTGAAPAVPRQVPHGRSDYRHLKHGLLAGG